MRTALPVVIAFFSGIIMVVTFGFDSEGTWLGQTREQLLVWVTIISGFTLLLGVVSITRVNFAAVKRKKDGWFYNVLTLIAVFITMIPAILPASLFPDSWSTLFGRGEGSVYDWFYLYLNKPMQATMFAMLAFYIASAAFRAFRARNAQATLLLVTATIIMLWQVPMGEAFLRSIHHDLPGLVNTYIMGGFNLAVQRGILIGAALGAASMALRIILGIERTYMGKA